MRKFKNYSRRISSKSDKPQFAWCIFCDEPAAVLEEVSAVEYTLHPTFPDPIRLVEDRETRFSLDSTGWGEFQVLIRIFLNTGAVERASHHLQLRDDDWPLGTAPAKFDDDADRAVFEGLMDPRFEFRRLATLAKLSATPEAHVRSALERFSARGLVRRVKYAAPFNEDLWGATAKVGVVPSLK